LFLIKKKSPPLRARSARKNTRNLNKEGEEGKRRGSGEENGRGG